jgi:hypothetical protein
VCKCKAPPLSTGPICCRAGHAAGSPVALGGPVCQTSSQDGSGQPAGLPAPAGHAAAWRIAAPAAAPHATGHGAARGSLHAASAPAPPRSAPAVHDAGAAAGDAAAGAHAAAARGAGPLAPCTSHAAADPSRTSGKAPPTHPHHTKPHQTPPCHTSSMQPPGGSRAGCPAITAEPARALARGPHPRPLCNAQVQQQQQQLQAAHLAALGAPQQARGPAGRQCSSCAQQLGADEMQHGGRCRQCQIYHQVRGGAPPGAQEQPAWGAGPCGPWLGPSRAPAGPQNTRQPPRTQLHLAAGLYGMHALRQLLSKSSWPLLPTWRAPRPISPLHCRPPSPADHPSSHTQTLSTPSPAAGGPVLHGVRPRVAAGGGRPGVLRPLPLLGPQPLRPARCPALQGELPASRGGVRTHGQLAAVAPAVLLSRPGTCHGQQQQRLPLCSPRRARPPLAAAASAPQRQTRGRAGAHHPPPPNTHTSHTSHTRTTPHPRATGLVSRRLRVPRLQQGAAWAGAAGGAARPGGAAAHDQAGQAARRLLDLLHGDAQVGGTGH